MKRFQSIPFTNMPVRGQGGFTLVEAVIVITVTAIIAGAVAIFIRMPVRSYVDSAARADLVDTGDTALRRMARDLRLALPNSIRTTTDGTGAAYIELLLTRTGGRYLSQQTDCPVSCGGNPLDFTGASLKFDIVGPVPANEQQIQPGDSVVVYNQVPGSIPADAYQTSGEMNRASITNINGPTITMASNPFGSYSLQSPSNRFQVISGPVTYRCDPSSGKLTRYWNYTISTSQPASVAALSTGSSQNALLANGVSSCTFSYSNANSSGSGLAVLDIKLFSNDSSSSSIGLFEQVHVDNTP